MVYDLIVVGGGPAGMLGAAAAGRRGLKVALLEKNAVLGKKLAITGNGRCNVTNSGDIEHYKGRIVTNGKFLYSALSTFGSRELMALLQALGVPTKVERGGRVFPASDRSGDVVGALQKYLRESRVEIYLNCEVRQVLTREGGVSGVLLARGGRLAGKRVLLATGGSSYLQTGSTGDGYKMAGALGHSVVSPRPALVPLEIGEAWLKDLRGLALEEVKVQGLAGGRAVAEQRGDVLFTHFGLSGPAILNISSFLGKHPGLPLKVRLDLKPDLAPEQLDHLIRDVLRQNAGRHLKNALSALLAQRLVPAVLALAGVGEQQQVDRVSREERTRIGGTVKKLELEVRGLRPLNEAIITAGGVSVKEINPSTLESKIIKGLYFAGEVIDVDALTGGYNLQIAFSTGYLSGSSAGKPAGR